MKKKSQTREQKWIETYEKINCLFQQWHEARLYGTVLLTELSQSFKDFAKLHGFGRKKVRRWANERGFQSHMVE